MSKQSLSKKIINRFWRLCEWFAEKRKPDNHHWVVQWDITHRCNLRCDYCFIDQSTDQTDIDNAKKTIMDLNPGYLIVSGGEPLIVPDIGNILREVYTNCNKPHLVINTNLTTKLNELYGLLDILDTIHISIDGLGEVNAQHRHVSGDVVFENIKKLNAEKQRRESSTSLLTLTVVTVDNYRNIPEMTDRILGDVPDMYMSYGSIEPHWDEISILRDPDKMTWFMETMQPLMIKYPERVILVGPLSPDNFLKNKSIEGNLVSTYQGRDWVNCKRQFFRSQVIPNGRILQCKPLRYIDHYKTQIQNNLKQKKFRSAFTSFRQMVYTTILKPYNQYCPFPCKCEEMLDDILSNRDIPEIKLFAGHFTHEELQDASRFCDAHWNQPLDPDIINKLMNPDTSNTCKKD